MDGGKNNPLFLILRQRLQEVCFSAENPPFFPAEHNFESRFLKTVFVGHHHQWWQGSPGCFAEGYCPGWHLGWIVSS